MRKIKLPALYLKIDTFKGIDPYSLFDEGLFYKECFEFIKFEYFEKKVKAILDSIELRSKLCYYDDELLFIEDVDNIYRLLPNSLSYYVNNKKVIDFDRCYKHPKIFVSSKQGNQFIHNTKQNVNSWLNILRERVK